MHLTLSVEKPSNAVSYICHMLRFDYQKFICYIHIGSKAKFARSSYLKFSLSLVLLIVLSYTHIKIE